MKNKARLFGATPIHGRKNYPSAKRFAWLPASILFAVLLMSGCATPHTSSAAYKVSVQGPAGWQAYASRVEADAGGATFTTRIKQANRQAGYQAVALSVHIRDAQGKLLGSAQATPETLPGYKAWFRTGVRYHARLDLNPPAGSQIELILTKK